MASDGTTSSFKAEVIIAAGGLVTGVLAAIANFLIALNSDLDVASIVPHGAGVMGLVAASGYYFAAIVTRQRPSRRLLLNMVLVGLSTFALTEYLAYQAVTVDGVRVADFVSFWDYYRVKVEHTQVQMLRGGGPSPELGALGYGWEAGRLLCFLFGSGLAFMYLQGKPYCETCKRYFGRRRMLLQTRESAKVDEFAQTLWFDVSDLAERYRKHVGSQKHYGFRVWVSGCKTCGLKHLTFAVAQQYVKVRFAIYPFRGESPFLNDLPPAAEKTTLDQEPATPLKASASRS